MLNSVPKNKMAITIIDICVFIVIFLIVLYVYGLRCYDYFKDTGVKSIKPSIPFIGSMSNLFIGKENFYELFKNMYDEYPNEKYIGIFESYKPMILIRDLELIKSVGIKHFDTFHDRRSLIPDIEEDIFQHVLIVMQGEKWREMRASLSPAFTSSKMKNLFVFMDECAKDMIQYYMNHKDIKDVRINECTKMRNIFVFMDECVKDITEYYLNQNDVKEKKMVEIDVKDTMSRYTNDVIANAVFGFKVNSLEDDDNAMYKYGLKTNDQGFVQILKMCGFIMFPKLMKLLKITFLRRSVTKFFKKIVKETMDDREKTGLVRQDVINLLIEAKNGNLVHEVGSAESEDTGFATVEESNIGKKKIKKKWTDSELAAQALIFFFAGFETSSLSLMFFVYEMARNPDVQKKLQDCIDECLKKNGGKTGYQDIIGLKYLDMCISENLRMWPPAVFSERVCSKPFTLPPPNNRSTKTFELQKGNLIWISIYGIMQDSKYYPNPGVFNPERFSDENKLNINPMSYLPFGIGPRNCIGSRFALLELKIIIFHLLSKFDIVPVESTQIPLKLKTNTMQIKPEKEVRVGLKLRCNN